MLYAAGVGINGPNSYQIVNNMNSGVRVTKVNLGNPKTV